MGAREVKAFGLNRSEMFTRQGHSPGVRFPRVLGIECVGVVADAGDSGIPAGATVAAVMGGMGRDYDGGYAEYALLPAMRLLRIETTLDWSVLGALPETFLTAAGSLEAMALGEGSSLLIRGATSSVGLAALTLAAGDGIEVAAATRNPAKADALRAKGARHVVVEGPELAASVRTIWPEGPEGLLDLIGGPAVIEALELVRSGGVVCNTGILGGVWTIPEFEPLEQIPSGVKLTTYRSGVIDAEWGSKTLQRIVEGVESGRCDANVDRVYGLDEIVDAHRAMEANRATGKLVVVNE